MVSSEGGGGPSGGGVDALSTRLNATFSKEPVAVPKGSQIETCSWLEEFFNFVSAAGVSAKLECAIPDTIVFKYHRPMTWYYWEEVTPAPSRPALDGTAHGGDACASSGALGASLRTAHACRSTSPQRRVAGLGGGAAAPAPGAAPGIVNQGVASGAAFAGGGADALSILAAPASGDGARAPDSCGGGGADGGGGGNTAERFGAASRPPSIAAPVALAAANAAAAAIAADPPPFRIGALVRHPDSVLALTAKEIHQGFCAPVDSAGRRHHSDLVAYYVRTAKDEYGSPVPTIEYFDEVGLRDFLYHREATDNGFLQRFTDPHGETNNLIRVQWTAHVLAVHICKNRHPYRERRLAPRARASTFDAEEMSKWQHPIERGPTRRRIKAQTERVLGAIRSQLQSRYEIVSAVLYFKLVAGARVERHAPALNLGGSNGGVRTVVRGPAGGCNAGATGESVTMEGSPCSPDGGGNAGAFGAGSTSGGCGASGVDGRLAVTCGSTTLAVTCGPASVTGVTAGGGTGGARGGKWGDKSTRPGLVPSELVLLWCQGIKVRNRTSERTNVSVPPTGLVAVDPSFSRMSVMPANYFRCPVCGTVIDSRAQYGVPFKIALQHLRQTGAENPETLRALLTSLGGTPQAGVRRVQKRKLPTYALEHIFEQHAAASQPHAHARDGAAAGADGARAATPAGGGGGGGGGGASCRRETSALSGDGEAFETADACGGAQSAQLASAALGWALHAFDELARIAAGGSRAGTPHAGAHGGAGGALPTSPIRLGASAAGLEGLGPAARVINPFTGATTCLDYRLAVESSAAAAATNGGGVGRGGARGGGAGAARARGANGGASGGAASDAQVELSSSVSHRRTGSALSASSGGGLPSHVAAPAHAAFAPPPPPPKSRAGAAVVLALTAATDPLVAARLELIDDRLEDDVEECAFRLLLHADVHLTPGRFKRLRDQADARFLAQELKMCMQCLLRFMDTATHEHMSLRRKLSAAGIVVAGPTGPQCSRAHYHAQMSKCDNDYDPYSLGRHAPPLTAAAAARSTVPAPGGGASPAARASLPALGAQRPPIAPPAAPPAAPPRDGAARAADAPPSDAVSAFRAHFAKLPMERAVAAERAARDAARAARPPEPPVFKRLFSLAPRPATTEGCAPLARSAATASAPVLPTAEPDARPSSRAAGAGSAPSARGTLGGVHGTMGCWGAGCADSGAQAGHGAASSAGGACWWKASSYAAPHALPLSPSATTCANGPDSHTGRCAYGGGVCGRRALSAEAAFAAAEAAAERADAAARAATKAARAAADERRAARGTALPRALSLYGARPRPRAAARAATPLAGGGGAERRTACVSTDLRARSASPSQRAGGSPSQRADAPRAPRTAALAQSPLQAPAQPVLRNQLRPDRPARSAAHDVGLPAPSALAPVALPTPSALAHVAPAQRSSATRASEGTWHVLPAAVQPRAPRGEAADAASAADADAPAEDGDEPPAPRGGEPAHARVPYDAPAHEPLLPRAAPSANGAWEPADKPPADETLPQPGAAAAAAEAEAEGGDVDGVALLAGGAAMPELPEIGDMGDSGDEGGC